MNGWRLQKTFKIMIHMKTDKKIQNKRVLLWVAEDPTGLIEYLHMKMHYNIHKEDYCH